MSSIAASERSHGAFGSPTTRFDRSLLRAASLLDAVVAARLERRGTGRWRDALASQTAAADARRAAQARGAIGILPR